MSDSSRILVIDDEKNIGLICCETAPEQLTRGKKSKKDLYCWEFIAPKAKNKKNCMRCSDLLRRKLILLKI